MVGVPLGVVDGDTVPQAGAQAVPPCVSVHVTPWPVGSFETLAVYCCVASSGISALGGELETTIAGTVTAAVADAPLNAAEAAVIVTARSLAGGVAGAVYVVEAPLAVDVGDNVPHGAGLQDTDQMTPLLLASLVTAAESVCWLPATRDADVGVTATVMPRTAIVPELNMAESVAKVAVKVTVNPPGGELGGAVYVVGPSLGVVVGDTLPHGDEAGVQERDQLTLPVPFTTAA